MGALDGRTAIVTGASTGIGLVTARALAAELERQLVDTMDQARAVIDELDPSRLLERHRVQGDDWSVLSILVHVVEHFSYHTGQVSYVVKAGKNCDLGYYQGLNLNKTGDE